MFVQNVWEKTHKIKKNTVRSCHKTKITARISVILIFLRCKTTRNCFTLKFLTDCHLLLPHVVCREMIMIGNGDHYCVTTFVALNQERWKEGVLEQLRASSHNNYTGQDREFVSKIIHTSLTSAYIQRYIYIINACTVADKTNVH